MTVNLWNGRADPHSLAAVLAGIRPDVVAAQEVGPDAARVLSTSHPCGVAVGATDITGRALVSTAPIDVVPFPLPSRPGLRATVGGIEIIAVHLANPLEGPGAWRTRRAQADAVLAAVAGLERVVVVGDMNATPIWPTYRRLSTGLDDGIADWAERHGRRPRPTWARFAPWPAMLRIDHVLTRGVVVRDVRVDRIIGGDHRAVTVDLETA